MKKRINLLNSKFSLDHKPTNCNTVIIIYVPNGNYAVSKNCITICNQLERMEQEAGLS